MSSCVKSDKRILSYEERVLAHNPFCWNKENCIIKGHFVHFCTNLSWGWELNRCDQLIEQYWWSCWTDCSSGKDEPSELFCVLCTILTSIKPCACAEYFDWLSYLEMWFEGCGMKSETMADISILNSNLFVLYINLIWLQCAMMHIASLLVIRSGSHTMQRDYHLKLRYLLCSQIINRNVKTSVLPVPLWLYWVIVLLMWHCIHGNPT